MPFSFSRRVKWFHINQCKLFDPTRAGKSKKGVRIGEQDDEQTPVDVETVGESGEPTGSQPEVACCRCAAAVVLEVDFKETVAQAASLCEEIKIRQVP